MDVISEHSRVWRHGWLLSPRLLLHNACDMRFSVFVPPQASSGKVPVLTWLSGLTCTEETFMIKAGAQRVAAELGLDAGRARHQSAR